MKYDASKILQRKKKFILEEWMKNQLSDESLREDLMTNEDLREQSDELLDGLLKALNENNLGNSASPDFENVLEILSGISITRARQGFTPKETGLYVLSLKEALLQTLLNEIKDNAEALYDATIKVNKLIDGFSMITFDTFIKGREEVILRQTSEISDISTPVIQIWDGILALPIIGTLDSARTQVVMESLLLKIVETESTIAILDISGVPAVDSLVAQHLIKTVAATRLMGAECIISGIRPEIAQTIVHLGIDLSGINTKSSLAHALKAAFNFKRLEVRSSSEISKSIK
jgi:rsbT co-antagonist protein RsbR